MWMIASLVSCMACAICAIWGLDIAAKIFITSAGVFFTIHLIFEA